MYCVSCNSLSEVIGIESTGVFYESKRKNCVNIMLENNTSLFAVCKFLPCKWLIPYTMQITYLEMLFTIECVNSAGM